jgi:hypothetical protein
MSKEAPESSEKKNKEGYLDKILDFYSRAKRSGQNLGGDVSSWLLRDVAQTGNWEYQVEDFSNRSRDSIVELLNEMGNKRWELADVISEEDEKLAIFKRPKESFLDYVPASELITLLPLAMNRKKKKGSK